MNRALIFTSDIRRTCSLTRLVPNSIIISKGAPTSRHQRVVSTFATQRVPYLVGCNIFARNASVPLVRAILLTQPAGGPSLCARVIKQKLELCASPMANCRGGSLELVSYLNISSSGDVYAPPALFKLGRESFPSEINGRRLSNSLLSLKEEIRRIRSYPSN